jgi:N-acetylneuraminate synthase
MKRCSLSEKDEYFLKKYVESKNMIYLCTPFSRKAADRLEHMGVFAFKIGSGECNNYPLIEHIAKFRKPIILSTGMNDIDSISKSIKIIDGANIPYAILHCTSIYPTPYSKVRLGALAVLKKEFPKAVLGLSDHSIGNYTCFASIPLGARILEKHFTSDKKWKGPDIPISISPKGLQDLLFGSKAIFNALGGEKNILIEEKPTINFAYACVVAIRDINTNERFSHNNIWVKRPGTGEIKATDYDKLIGKTAKRPIKNNKQIKWQDINE